MAKVTIPKLTVIYREVFRMQPFYRFMMKWLQEHEFYDLKGQANMNNLEILFSQRNGTTQRPNERELNIWWRSQKHFVGANRYIRHRIDLDITVVQMTDVEVMIAGKKEKVQHGEIKVDIKPYLDVEEFGAHPLLKYIDRFFRTRILKRNLEEQKKQLYQESYEFQNAIKEYLELKTFLPHEERFHEKMQFI